MSTWNRSLWKTAERLEATYRTNRTPHHALHLPVDDWQVSLASFHRLELAEQRSWHAAARQQQGRLTYDLEQVNRRLESLINRLRTPTPPSPPTAALLYAELQAIADQSERWDLDGNELVVVTESITLEEIDLGPFEIRLEVDRLPESDSYRVVALRPNPASSSDETTHPHVQDETLCPGEGRASIAAALQEGRLSDFYTIIDRILHTYSSGSAYVELSRWHGVPCQDCDASIDEDETYYCHACEHTLCGDCSLSCNHCGTGYCAGCIDRCYRCEESTCPGCLRNCARCRESVCAGCLDDGICTHCEEELANDQVETSTTATPQPAV